MTYEVLQVGAGLLATGIVLIAIHRQEREAPQWLVCGILATVAGSLTLAFQALLWLVEGLAVR